METEGWRGAGFFGAFLMGDPLGRVESAGGDSEVGSLLGMSLSDFGLVDFDCIIYEQMYHSMKHSMS